MKIFCLFLISIPLISLAGILWEDNFDSYTVGMKLEESPYWDRLSQNNWYFRISYQKDNDNWVYGVYEIGVYIASGGAYDPNMKVSALEVNIPKLYTESYISYIGVATRVSYDGKCYIAAYQLSKSIEPDQYYYKAFILMGNRNNSLNSIRLTGPVKTITITATGDNPVHISAWFDNYHLEYDETRYKLNSGYGGIYCETNGAPAYLDDFFEETTTDIEPASLGIVKALFR